MKVKVTCSGLINSTYLHPFKPSPVMFDEYEREEIIEISDEDLLNLQGYGADNVLYSKCQEIFEQKLRPEFVLKYEVMAPDKSTKTSKCSEEAGKSES